jgi:hypothetical protein
MSEDVIVRDIDDNQAEGYMVISQILGKIRSICLSGKKTQTISIEDTLHTIRGLLHELENTMLRFARSFSEEERETIRNYIKEVKSELENWVEEDPEALSQMLEELYHRSTKLSGFLGTFKMTI